MADAKEKATTPAAPAKPATPKEDPKVAIPKLLDLLKNATEQGDKRKLRARLRALGHRGGLPKEDRPVREKKAKAPAATTAAASTTAAPAKAPLPPKKTSRAAG